MIRALVILLGFSIIANVILIVFILFGMKPNYSAVFRDDFPFLSPRLTIENPNDVLINFVSLRTKLNEYYKQVEDPLGLYFEYLPSGVSIGLNDKESFTLASLLKVPLVMAVYNQINKGTLTLDHFLEIKDNNLDSHFGDLWKRGVGVQITVREAIYLALVESDNTAKSLLFSTLPVGGLEEVFDYLDIPKEFGETPVVTAKNYSSILRSLYLSSYLPVEQSNEILNLLAQTKFNDKIAAGVPGNIAVAHKIGVVYDVGRVGGFIFTDCGIVYVPRRPYILCVMTKSDEETAKRYMSEISKIIYEYVSSINNAR